MSLLFIEPTPGHLSPVKAELEKEYAVTFIGYGMPPLYIEAQPDKHDEIMEIVWEIDEKATSSDFRADIYAELVHVNGLPRLFLKFYVDLEALRQFAYVLDVNLIHLPGGGNDPRALARELVDYCERNGKIVDMLKAFYADFPHAVKELPLKS